MTQEKTPALLGADTGGMCKRQPRHFTTKQRKNAQVHHHAGAIIRVGAEHTLDTAVATFAEKKVFSRPDFLGTAAHGRGSYWLMGLGASIPQGRRHGCIRVFKPSPTMQSEQLHCGFSVHTGTGTMKSTTTGASPTTTHDHHQAALVLRAQNHLALALFELRNSTGDTPTRKAMGLAYAAARSLSQVVGGAV